MTMLAVLLAPVVGELVEPFALGPSAVLQLKQQMEKMRASMGAPQPTRAVNPCFEVCMRATLGPPPPCRVLACSLRCLHAVAGSDGALDRLGLTTACPSSPLRDRI